MQLRRFFICSAVVAGLVAAVAGGLAAAPAGAPDNPGAPAAPPAGRRGQRGGRSGAQAQGGAATPIGVDAVRVFTGHTGGVTALAFSPDGKILASAGMDRSVILWDVQTGKELEKADNASAVRCVAFSPDGKHLAWGMDDHTIKTWDVEKKIVDGTHTQECPVVSLAFLPDSEHFASCCGGMLRFWDVAKTDQVRAHDTGFALFGLAVSTSGKVVALDFFCHLFEWDPLADNLIATHTRTRASTPSGPIQNGPWGICALPQDHVLVNDQTGLWDWDLKKDTLALQARRLRMLGGATADGKYYAGAALDHDFWFREAGPTGTLIEPKAPADLHTSAISPDGKFIAVSGGGNTYDDKQWKPVPPFDIQVNTVGPLARQLNAQARGERRGRIAPAPGETRANFSAVEASDPPPIPWE